MKKLRVLFLTLALAVGLAATAFAYDITTWWPEEHPLTGLPTQYAPITFTKECPHCKDGSMQRVTIDPVRAVKKTLNVQDQLDNGGFFEDREVTVLYYQPGVTQVTIEGPCPHGAWEYRVLGHSDYPWFDEVYRADDGINLENGVLGDYYVMRYHQTMDLDYDEEGFPTVMLVPEGFFGEDEPEPTPEPEQPAIPATGTAYALEQTAVLDGKEIDFDTYALKDENGNGTNYMKIRDLAYVLNGSKAQFALGYDAGSISFNSKTPYTPNGTEMTVPFSGDQTYSVTPGTFRVDGREVKMTTVSILDAAGNGYTYIKVRDLAEALNFYVGWNGKIVIDTSRPYET